MSDRPPKHALNNPKWRLSAPCPTAKGKYSNLSVDVWNNNPRVVVATNDPKFDGDKTNNYGRITAALEPAMFWVFLEMIDEAIAAPGKKKIVMENFGKAKDADFKSPPVHLTDLCVGKDDEGQIYAYVANKAEGWPLVKFVFGPSDQRFHHLVHGNGERWTKAELSVIAARAWRRGLGEVMGNVLDSRYVEPPKRDFGGGGQRQGGGGYGGGGQRPGYGGGAPAARPAVAAGDDFGGDIDF